MPGKNQNFLNDEDFKKLEWVFGLSQTWMLDPKRAVDYAVNVLIDEGDPVVSSIPKEMLSTDLGGPEGMNRNGVSTVIPVMERIIGKLKILLAMDWKYQPRDKAVLAAIKKNMEGFLSNLRNMSIEAFGYDVGYGDETGSMGREEIKRNIESILDAHSEGKITDEQMKNRLMEFKAKKTLGDIGKFGGNIMGSLGLVKSADTIKIWNKELEVKVHDGSADEVEYLLTDLKTGRQYFTIRSEKDPTLMFLVDAKDFTKHGWHDDVWLTDKGGGLRLWGGR